MILVTGGAGYIGSHTVRLLHDRGDKVLVLDNLSSGHAWAIPKGVELIVGDIRDKELISNIFKKFQIDSIIHFAAKLSVEESVHEPLLYYNNNVLGSLNLIEEADKAKIKYFIFSSTCAVYGTPSENPVTEKTPLNPLSPYGKSKLIIENILRDLEASKTSQMRNVILRYFNVAGARVGGELGQSTPKATQLIKVACEVACRKRNILQVFGTDYPTHDGTCIRDYIHVDDLAQAHLLALDYLKKGGTSETLNCAYGRGFSVLDILSTLEKVIEKKIPVNFTTRRAGDAEAIWADASRLKKTLDWKPKYDNLEIICKTAYEWEKEGKV